MDVTKENRIDDITRLALNIYTNKGAYAPLLGSGVSLPAGILSGWKVTEDLLKKLAYMHENIIPDDVFTWYKAKYGKDAEYSDLLSELGHGSAEIGNLLWSYFEPSPEEMENHLKEPTEAHRAIAEMASKGYFKVILTTNFDRLLESALDLRGVKYQVVSNESQLDRAVPIVHFPLTVVKVNGDYKETSVRNTEDELANYPDSWNNYLIRILSEFGIVSCGWSASWDIALIEDIKKCSAHKYSYCFTYVDELKSEDIMKLSHECNGEAFRIDSGDSLFAELAEKVKALEEINSMDMEIDKEIAVTRVKDYIKKEDLIIKYTDLFENETNKAIERASEYTFTHEQMTAQLYTETYTKAFGQLSVLLPMSYVAVRWAADDIHRGVIVDVLSNVANRPISKTGILQEHSRKQNHALDTVYLYGVGVACVYYRNFTLLDQLLRVKLDDTTGLFSEYLIDIVNCWIIDKEDWNRTTQVDRKKTPFSWLISQLLRPSLNFIKNDGDFEAYFCIFEKMLAMYYYMLITVTIGEDLSSAPIGQFGWMEPYLMREGRNKYKEFFNEIEGLKSNSPQLKSGMFEGSYEKYSGVLAKVNEIQNAARAYML